MTRGERLARRLTRLLFPAALADVATLAAVRTTLASGDLTTTSATSCLSKGQNY